MILVIGGLGAGKCAYVEAEYGYTGADMADAALNDKPVLYNLQAMNAPPIEALLKKHVVICNEIGCGVVPVSAEEREKRETLGRLCVELAKHAERVVRVQCGIPVIIKETKCSRPS
jgi:adenosyl cobinamide kinase/adenosyl cobinamide phosphate guanylyltransferase